MVSDVSAVPRANAKASFEWTVVSAAVLGGGAIALGGLGYGLTATTGVGAGFFPVIAGGVTALGGLLWAFQIIGDRRRRKTEATGLIGEGVPPDPAAAPNRADPPTDTAIGVLVVDGIDEDDDGIALPDQRGLQRVVTVVLVVVLAAVLLPWLGYLLTMTLMLVAVMTLVGQRRWWVALIVGFGAALASRFVFETLLGTVLPHAGLDLLRGIGL